MSFELNEMTYFLRPDRLAMTNY